MKANHSSQESVSDIMERVSHADLLSHYFGIDSLPVLINSPLREDKHPSFSLFSPDGIKVYYKDYATGENGDIYSLLQKVYHCDFSQLMHKIASEKAFEKRNCSYRSSSKKKFLRTTRDLKVAVREWRDYDMEYWNSYGISIEWLKYAEVYPISHKIIYKNGNRYVFHAAKYAYVFVERKEGNISLKVYQPMAEKRYKWDNSNDASVVGLWSKMPLSGDKLVIASSLKDALCLWANTGIPAIYVQSETTGLSNTAQEVLRYRFSNIYICFDNDPPGLKDAENLSSLTGFKNVVLPPFQGGKDISDLYKIVGKEKFKQIVIPLFDGEQESQECHLL